MSHAIAGRKGTSFCARSWFPIWDEISFATHPSQTVTVYSEIETRQLDYLMTYKRTMSADTVTIQYLAHTEAFRIEMASPIKSGNSAFELWEPAGFIFATPALSCRWTRHSTLVYA